MNYSQQLRQQQIAKHVYDLVAPLASPLGLRKTQQGLTMRCSGRVLMHIHPAKFECIDKESTSLLFETPWKATYEWPLAMRIPVFYARIRKHIRQLDHIGFCYSVESQLAERNRIARKKLPYPFRWYEMASNDAAKWYFLGNTKHATDPMIELLPVQAPGPKDASLWLPHIHIDLNTTLSGYDVTRMMRACFGQGYPPISFTDPLYGTHCVRIQLGTIAGVHIMLDISTEVRNIPYVRTHLLTPLDA